MQDSVDEYLKVAKLIYKELVRFDQLLAQHEDCRPTAHAAMFTCLAKAHQEKE